MDMKLVKKCIEGVRKRKGIKTNKTKRYQSYCFIAHAHKFKQRSKLPDEVIQMVRDAFPDPNNAYSSSKPMHK